MRNQTGLLPRTLTRRHSLRLAGFQTQAEVLLVAQVRCQLFSLIQKDYRLPVDVYTNQPHGGYDYEMRLAGRPEKMFVKKNPVDSIRDKSAFISFSLKEKMAVVGAGAEVVRSSISELQLEQTCIACFNATKGQPISGPVSEVEHLIQKLRVDNANLFVRKLSTDDVVYHAPYLNAFRDYLRVQSALLQKRNHTFLVEVN